MATCTAAADLTGAEWTDQNHVVHSTAPCALDDTHDPAVQPHAAFLNGPDLPPTHVWPNLTITA